MEKAAGLDGAWAQAVPFPGGAFPTTVQEAMMVHFGTWILLSSFLATGGDSPPVPPEAVKPVEADIRFADGSQVRAILLPEQLEVMTRYGKLTIPVRDIRKIDFGLHMSEGVRQRIDEAIKQLGSDTYRQRQDAVKQLITLGPLAYPAVHVASTSSDPEVAKRAQAVIKTLKDKLPADQLRTKVEDFIVTAEFPLTGRILTPSLKARTVYFGEVDLRLSDLRHLRLRGGWGDLEVVVDAGKYGSTPDTWLDSGFAVDTHAGLVITATGTVDLWPQTPGQYTATPKGYGQPGPGKNGRFMAASLIGRIGENGTPFLIGDRYEGAPGQEGHLFLHIIPSPWNNASTGSYSVKISSTGVAPGR
jgi:hypothetical protein